MIIDKSPSHSAELSGAKEIGSFTMSTSAAAFQVLSSGLYSNKIRAIIRELSTNAFDSHVEAGRADMPFYVHLPTAIEPWFAVRDYGVGLSHDSIVNVYTTYFSSTKADSNDFVGHFGLGSKSPFAYSNNFTVTAIKDGRKGIYTAYISDSGIPSIALLAEMESDEAPGVEVKFAVTESSDFWSFTSEAAEVYTYFNVQPEFNIDVPVKKPEYSMVNIIDGVNQFRYSSKSYAVMGNIAYPINIPNSNTKLGDLGPLLNCGLELRFSLGELDLQPSREGLSYIDLTVESIRKKLEQIKKSIAVRIGMEMATITNQWERCEKLMAFASNTLTSSAAVEYLKHNPCDLVDSDGRNVRYGSIFIDIHQVLAKYNINVRLYKCRGYARTYSNMSPVQNSAGNPAFELPGDYSRVNFFENDIKIGGISRMLSKINFTSTRSCALLLSPGDKNKPMDLDGFYTSIFEPPVTCITKLSDIPAPTRAPSNTDRRQTMNILVYRDYSGWSDYGPLSDFSEQQQFYYVPLSNYQLISSVYSSINEMEDELGSTNAIQNHTIFGVRKKFIKEVESMPNWTPVEDYLGEKIKALSADKIVALAVRASSSKNDQFKPLVAYLKKTNPYVTIYEELHKMADGHTVYDVADFLNLVSRFRDDANVIRDRYRTILDEIKSITDRYPLLRLDKFSQYAEEMAEYVNMCDELHDHRSQQHNLTSTAI